MTTGKLLLRILCYACLAVIGLAGLLLLALRTSGQCVTLAGMGLRCQTDWAEAVSGAAIDVLLAAAYTGVPSFLAAMGIVYGGKDAWRWWQRRRGHEPVGSRPRRPSSTRPG